MARSAQKRPKPLELPEMTGPGVGQIKDKELEKYGGELDELRDQRANLSEEITQVEKNAVARMKEKGLARYRYGDREMILTAGNEKIKTKEVKGSADSNGD